MTAEHRCRHASHSARHRRDRIHDRLRLVELHVTTELLLLLVPADSDVDHDLALPKILCADALHLTGCSDHDIRFPCDGRNIDRPRVADSDRRIFMHEHHGDRAADHERPSDDCRALSSDIYSVKMKDLHRCLSRTGRKSNLRICENAGQRSVCTAVHILCRIDHLPCPLPVKMPGKRSEQKNSMDIRILIYTPKLPEKSITVHIFGKNDLLHIDSH